MANKHIKEEETLKARLELKVHQMVEDICVTLAENIGLVIKPNSFKRGDKEFLEHGVENADVLLRLIGETTEFFMLNLICEIGKELSADENNHSYIALSFVLQKLLENKSNMLKKMFNHIIVDVEKVASKTFTKGKPNKEILH